MKQKVVDFHQYERTQHIVTDTGRVYYRSKIRHKWSEWMPVDLGDIPEVEGDQESQS